MNQSKTPGFDPKWLEPGGMVPVDASTTAVLCAEVHRLLALLRGGFDGSKEMQAEIDRLREEVAEWRQAAKVEAGLRREFCDECDRLRAEKAELLAALKYADRYRSVWPPGLRNAVDAILAKTAKEG